MVLPLFIAAAVLAVIIGIVVVVAYLYFVYLGLCWMVKSVTKLYKSCPYDIFEHFWPPKKSKWAEPKRKRTTKKPKGPNV